MLQVDKMLAEDISKLMVMLPHEDNKIRAEESRGEVTGGGFDTIKDTATPFGYGEGVGINEGKGDVEWVVAKDRFKYDNAFDKLNPVDGKISGAGKTVFFCKCMNSKTSNTKREMNTYVFCTGHCRITTTLYFIVY